MNWRQKMLLYMSVEYYTIMSVFALLHYIVWSWMTVFYSSQIIWIVYESCHKVRNEVSVQRSNTEQLKNLSSDCFDNMLRIKPDNGHLQEILAYSLAMQLNMSCQENGMADNKLSSIHSIVPQSNLKHLSESNVTLPKVYHLTNSFVCYKIKVKVLQVSMSRLIQDWK